MEGSQTTPQASIVWYDEEENPLITFEWDDDGMKIISNVISHGEPMQVRDEEASQLRDFLNEKFAPNTEAIPQPQAPEDQKIHSYGLDDSTVSDPGRYAPLAKDHPAVGMICPGCQEEMKAGDTPAMVAIGPGPDPEARAAARKGEGYSGVGIVCHEECVHG